MRRTRALLTLVSSLVVLLAAVASWADDEEKSPLGKIMVKVDAETKTIRDATSTIKKFKAASNGKALIPATKKLLKLGKETRVFKEPSEQMKKPFEKWTDLADRFVAATEDIAKASEKGNLVDARKGLSSLTNTCTNCHGAFRPSVDAGF